MQRKRLLSKSSPHSRGIDTAELHVFTTKPPEITFKGLRKNKDHALKFPCNTPAISCLTTFESIAIGSAELNNLKPRLPTFHHSVFGIMVSHVRKKQSSQCALKFPCTQNFLFVSFRYYNYSPLFENFTSLESSS